MVAHAGKSRARLPRPLIKQVEWPVAAFFSLVGVMALGAIYWMITVRCHWATIVMAVTLYQLAGFGVTAGYHRCVTHRSFRCHPVLLVVLLLLAAATLQLSALIWASRHLWHHKCPDDPEHDPYPLCWGVTYAHFASLSKIYKDDFANVQHLRFSRLIMLQHRFYWPLAIGMGLLLPTIVASFWGDAFGGLLIGGFLRLLVQYNAAFSVNSIAHWLGERDLKIPGSSANLRNPVLKLVLGFATAGEILRHRIHHAFPGLALTGSKLDFTGLALRGLARLGLVTGLHRLPAGAIQKRLAQGH